MTDTAHPCQCLAVGQNSMMDATPEPQRLLQPMGVAALAQQRDVATTRTVTIARNFEDDIRRPEDVMIKKLNQRIKADLSLIKIRMSVMG